MKAIPGASRDEVAGWLGETLRVRVTAPPERGRANAAVEAVIAGALALPLANVRVVSGATSQRKVVEVSGLSEVEARQRLARILD